MSDNATDLFRFRAELLRDIYDSIHADNSLLQYLEGQTKLAVFIQMTSEQPTGFAPVFSIMFWQVKWKG